jgi:hypothetical protein
MKKTIRITSILLIALFLASCNSQTKNKIINNNLGFSFDFPENIWHKYNDDKKNNYRKLLDSLSGKNEINKNDFDLLYLFTKNNDNRLLNPYVNILKINKGKGDFEYFKNNLPNHKKINIKDLDSKNISFDLNKIFVDEENQIIGTLMNSNGIFASSFYIFPKGNLIQFNFSESTDGNWEDNYISFKDKIINSIEYLK